MPVVESSMFSSAVWIQHLHQGEEFCILFWIVRRYALPSFTQPSFCISSRRNCLTSDVLFDDVSDIRVRRRCHGAKDRYLCSPLLRSRHSVPNTTNDVATLMDYSRRDIFKIRQQVG